MPRADNVGRVVRLVWFAFVALLMIFFLVKFFSAKSSMF